MAGAERGAHAGQGSAILTAHQFDENVDIVRLRQRHRIVEPGDAVKSNAAVARPVAGAHAHQPDRPSGLGGKVVFVAVQGLDNGRADRSQSRNAKSQRAFHRPVRLQIDFRETAQRLALSGMTLCRFSSADARNRPTFRAACRMRCSFSTSAILT